MLFALNKSVVSLFVGKALNKGFVLFALNKSVVALFVGKVLNKGLVLFLVVEQK